MGRELPGNWVNTTLDLIATVQSGGTPSRSKKNYWDGDVHWVKISDIKKWYVDTTTETITQEGLDNSSTKIFPKGTILFTIFATIGKVGVLNIDAATNQAIAGITPIKTIEHKYLTYALIELAETLEKQGKGVAQKNINLTILKALNVPLPPLPEQKRIVAKLDDLFAHLEAVKTHLKKVPQLLINFRQSVLTKAACGELTKKFRKENNLHEWETIMSSELFNFITSGSRGWAKYYNQDGEQLFVRITNMNYGTFELDLDPNKLQFLSLPDSSEGKRTLLQYRDILISITADVGMISIIPNDFPFEGYVNQHVCLARPIKSVNEKFLAFFLMSEKGFGQLKDKSRGATKAGLTLKDIRNIEVDLPNKIEQLEIVSRIEALFSKADAIEEKYTILKQKVDNLPQAILAKAFKGELVEQLESDGSAKELLKEIERLNLETKKKK